MLVLQRMENEKVVITVPPSAGPRRIEVMACRTLHDRVKLGFTAADDVEINRAEVQRHVDKKATLKPPPPPPPFPPLYDIVGGVSPMTAAEAQQAPKAG